MSTGSNGDREAARFSGRVRRYARVGTSVGGLAAGWRASVCSASRSTGEPMPRICVRRWVG